jgi:hypothetical protein
MAKTKRKSRRIKRAPVLIKQAQWAKRHGLISKRAKLTGGRMSPSVFKKIENLSFARAVPTYTFKQGMKNAVIDEKPVRKAVKVSKAQRAEYKLNGIPLFNGHALVSDTPENKAAVSEGKTVGFRPSPGFDETSVDVIVLADEGIENYRDLKKALRSGRLDKKYIKEKKLYAFTYFDHNPKRGMTFLTGKELADYLERYQWTEDAFDAFELITLPDGSTLGPTPQWVKDRDRIKYGADGRRNKKRKARVAKFKVERNRMSAEVAREKNKVKLQKYRLAQRAKFGELYVKKESEARSRRRSKGFDF